MHPVEVHASKLGTKIQETLEQHGIKPAEVQIAIAPGAAVKILEDEGQLEERDRYIIEYCTRNKLTLRDLFIGKGGGPDLNNIDCDSVPLQEAAIDMWNSWSNEQKIQTIENSLNNGKMLDAMLTDECEQVREGARLYAERQCSPQQEE